MTKLLVKVFGERNTGTRALIQMLRASGEVQLIGGSSSEVLGHGEWSSLQAGIKRHFTGDWRKIYGDALRDNSLHLDMPLMAWKHAAPDWHPIYAAKGVSPVFIVRDPYSWALSMARRPYHMKAPRTGDLQQFFARPWLTERRDNLEPVLPSVLSLWSEKCGAYLRMAEMATDVSPQFVKFEDLVVWPDETVAELVRRLGGSGEDIQGFDHSTKDERSAEELRQYYSAEEWVDYLSQDSVEVINQHIDWAVAGDLGYAKRQPKDFPSEIQSEKQDDLKRSMLLDRAPPSDRKAGAATAA
ncbi:MAG: hypothetical protein AAF826_09150 [Pseudomonadota bacterium]